MDNFSKILASLGAPKLFRDVTIFISGSGFILLLSYGYSLNISSELNRLGLSNSWGSILVFIIICYLSGRLLLMIGDICLAIIYLIFQKERKVFVYIWEFLQTGDLKKMRDEIIEPKKVKDTIFPGERLAYQEARLGNFGERAILSFIFFKTMAAASLIFAVLFSSIWLLPFSIFLIFSIWENFQIAYNDSMVGFILWKDKLNKKD